MGLKEFKENIKKDYWTYIIVLTCLFISLLCLNQMKEADRVCDERWMSWVNATLLSNQRPAWFPISLNLTDMNQTTTYPGETKLL